MGNRTSSTASGGRVQHRPNDSKSGAGGLAAPLHADTDVDTSENNDPSPIPSTPPRHPLDKARPSGQTGEQSSAVTPRESGYDDEMWSTGSEAHGDRWTPLSACQLQRMGALGNVSHALLSRLLGPDDVLKEIDLIDHEHQASHVDSAWHQVSYLPRPYLRPLPPRRSFIDINMMHALQYSIYP